MTYNTAASTEWNSDANDCWVENHIHLGKKNILWNVYRWPQSNGAKKWTNRKSLRKVFKTCGNACTHRLKLWQKTLCWKFVVFITLLFTQVHPVWTINAKYNQIEAIIKWKRKKKWKKTCLKRRKRRYFMWNTFLCWSSISKAWLKFSYAAYAWLLTVFDLNACVYLFNVLMNGHVQR